MMGLKVYRPGKPPTCGCGAEMRYIGPDYTREHWVCEECGEGGTRPIGSDGGASVPWTQEGE